MWKQHKLRFFFSWQTSRYFWYKKPSDTYTAHVTAGLTNISFLMKANIWEMQKIFQASNDYMAIAISFFDTF